MPSSAGNMRDALSRSMADIDYQHDPGTRRARQKPKKDALAQSCSAFNFILDSEDITSSVKKRSSRDNKKETDTGIHNNNNKARRSGSTGSAEKPSYSDLVMDATSNKINYHASQLTSPTSVLEEGGESGEGADGKQERDNNGNTAAAPINSSKSEHRTTRSIPSSNDISRRQIMMGQSSKSRSTRVDTARHSVHIDGPLARRQRRANNNHKLASRTGHALHMSMQDFPEPSDFQQVREEEEEVDEDSPAGTRNTRERFSKSFSGFDADWDPNEFLAKRGPSPTNTSDAIAALSTTPTRRRGKKPLNFPKNPRDTDFNPDEISIDDDSFGVMYNSKNGSGNDNGSDNGNGDSFTEMDLLKGLPDQKIAPKGRSRSQGPSDRFSQSFSSLKSSTSASSRSNQSSSDPKTRLPRRRRSSINEEMAKTAKLLASAGASKTKVEREKVSVSEFNSGEDEEIQKPATLSKRNSKDKREKALTRVQGGKSSGCGSAEVESGRRRIRRTKSHDGSVKIQSIRGTDGGAPTSRRRRSVQDPDNRVTRGITDGDAGDNDAVAATTTRNPEKQSRRVSTSRDPSRRRRKSTNHSLSVERSVEEKDGVGRQRRQSMPSVHKRDLAISDLQETPEPKPRRRVPGRSKSGDMSPGLVAASPMHVSSRRIGIRRTKSSDGSQLHSSMRRLRSSTASPPRKPLNASLGKSLSHIPDVSRLRRGADLSPVSRAGQSTASSVRGSRKPSSRKKLPPKAKSYDESSAPFVKRSIRDRSKSKERRPRRRRSSIDMSNPTGAVESGKLQGSAVTPMSAAERRAHAHAIMRD